MFKTECHDLHPFQIIPGGQGLAPSLARPMAARTAPPQAPEPSPEARARAADMVALYALSLLRETPFDTLARSDRATIAPGLPSLDHAALRAEVAHAVESELPTTGDLFARITGGPAHRLSSLWGASAPDREVANGGTLPPPSDDAPISQWLRWCRHRHGAALALPGRPRAALPASAADLARRVAQRGVLQPVIVAALARFSQGATPRIGPPQLVLRLLSELSERIAARAARSSSPAGPRPGLLAGELALLASGESASSMPDGAMATGVLTELTRRVPRLLAQLVAVNDARPFGGTVVRRDGERCTGWCPVVLARNLCMPPLLTASGPMHPGTLRTAPFQAAALAAALRTWLPHDEEAGAELDRLVRDVALATAAPGGLWPHEIAQQVETGADVGRRAALEALIGLDAEAGPDALPQVALSSV
ncbi:hypothetical protein OCH239_08770 [Roseivivax halodurans JCM 10272]|uniref:Uncharacterized protein n=1 Tax=Roseivivax halodurans JCM 10272 TaxID=1449350 RepID=X7EK54_9RHOB|nr:hypothetical protein [Roseivivax halodurans]ETX16265.1 hypothetical protein OCH239_08770 [Roseivivax halodurans JCM 10272]